MFDGLVLNIHYYFNIIIETFYSIWIYTKYCQTQYLKNVYFENIAQNLTDIEGKGRVFKLIAYLCMSVGRLPVMQKSIKCE